MNKAFMLLSVAVVSVCPLFAQPVTPQSGGNGLFYLQFANIYFEVDSTYGGRVSSLKVDNQEILFLDRNYPAGPYWGSTFWLSPEDGNHSPPSVERYFYTGGIAGNKIILTSQNTVTPTAIINVVKQYQADLADTSVTITCRIINLGPLPFMRAGWEVTRVMPEGSLTFWPTGDTLWGTLASQIVKNGLYSWYPFAATDPASGTKYFADGREGWYGHVTGGRVLFVKKFTEVPRAKQAPREAEIEFWLSADHKYVELENQSAYSLIDSGATFEYAVKWYLRKLPQSVSVAVGSQTLLTYARSVAGIDPSATRKVFSPRTLENPANSPGHVLRISTGASRTAPASNRRGVYTLRGERLKRPPLHGPYLQ